MGRFDGQTVIVTGGARGMGASHARAFAGEGASVLIADVLDEEGEALTGEIGESAVFAHLDVTSEAGWTTVVAIAEEAFGPVTVLVNNAGILRVATIDETDPATWRQVIDVNLTGQYLGIRAVAPSMRRAGGGAIVNVSSAAGLMATPGIAAYAAAKWGLRGLTRSAAVELGKDGIRVNSVHPGVVRTAMSGLMSGGADVPDPVAAFAIARVAEPDEVTRLVLFVVSGDAGFSTGAEFVADGGMRLGPALQGAGKQDETSAAPGGRHERDGSARLRWTVPFRPPGPLGRDGTA